MIATHNNVPYYPIYIDPYLRLEMAQDAIDEERGISEAKPHSTVLPAPLKAKTGPARGYMYPRVKCPDCNRIIALNWIVRHCKSNCEVG